jgi:hypothetical protein
MRFGSVGWHVHDGGGSGKMCLWKTFCLCHQGWDREIYGWTFFNLGHRRSTIIEKILMGSGADGGGLTEGLYSYSGLAFLDSSSLSHPLGIHKLYGARLINKQTKKLRILQSVRTRSDSSVYNAEMLGQV